MRPLRIQLEGFASFREPTVVDLSDADYFVLVGPTGAGKSSLIDAIAFALYGSVPRYDDRRLVAPVISQGRLEARVGLEFGLGPVRYRAVRVVRAAARGKGASTKEARLERLVDGEEPEVVAGDADGVTREVERLLGLTFDHFTKCVVLPQGAFAAFLNDKPADRGDLLVKLLDLGLYAQVAARARQAATAADARTSALEDRLGRPPLAGATPEALRGAEARVAELERLRADVAAAVVELEALDSAVAAATGAVETSERAVALLVTVTVPANVAALAATRAAATDAAAIGAAALAACEEETAKAEKALASQPDTAPLQAAATAHEDLETLRARIDKGTRTVGDLDRADAAAAAAEAVAVLAADEAVRRRDEAVAADQAASLARHLRAGQPCPVCGQSVAVVPTARRRATTLDQVERDVVTSATARNEAAAARAAAGKDLAQAAALLADLDERRVAAEATVAPFGDAAAVAGALALVRAATVGAEAARAAERAARAAATEAFGVAQRAEGAEAAARATFDQVRDSVAALAPPPAGRADLVADWAALAEWAASASAAATAAARVARERAVSAETARQAAADRLRASCGDAGVDIAVSREREAGEAVVGVLERSRGEAERLQEAIAEATTVRESLAASSQEAGVARALAHYLDAKHFEAWVLDEALTLLVEGATALLRDLSAGAYSLTLDGSAFAVIDHRNADAVRMSKTLSGGETFLASLSLALALADRLGELAAEGSSPLEAIFLDEGFGTLDPDTLDTVAAAIEGLAARGRVVGLVTHVRELADRVPIRFEVTKGPTTSTVERVDG